MRNGNAEIRNYGRELVIRDAIGAPLTLLDIYFAVLCRREEWS